MAMSFEFPVVYFYSDDLEDAEVSYCKGAINPIQLDQEPYEVNLEAQGYRFHLIFGTQINGNFLCIPNWQFGCELAGLSDKEWNLDSILKVGSQLDYEDATAIVWGLALISELLDN